MVSVATSRVYEPGTISVVYGRLVRRTSTTALIAVIATAALAIYAVLWLSVTDKQIGRSDFTSTYVGATLWRDGHHTDLYDRQLQSALHTKLIAPDTEGNLPFVNPPTAAVTVAPLSLLGLHTAYRIWSLLQTALLVAAVMVALMARPARRLQFLPIALAIPATLALLLLGQWDGAGALGIALAYLSFTKGRHATAGALLAAGMLLAKPHLALGIAAFVLGWRQRRLIWGAIMASLATLLIDVAAVGFSGMHGYISIELYDASRWNFASFLGFNGFFDAWLNNSTASQILGWLCGALAVITAGWFGWQVRRGRSLELAFAGAVTLSLLASPHLLSHD